MLSILNCPIPFHPLPPPVQAQQTAQNTSGIITKACAFTSYSNENTPKTNLIAVINIGSELATSHEYENPKAPKVSMESSHHTI